MKIYNALNEMPDTVIIGSLSDYSLLTLSSTESIPRVCESKKLFHLLYGLPGNLCRFGIRDSPRLVGVVEIWGI